MINMTPEIGHILLIISTVLALLSATIHFVGINQSQLYLIEFGNKLFNAMFISLLSALLCLIYSFISDDFSVAYVANHSNSQLALGYKIAAVWGSHEGSMLFWVFAIALWGAIINWRQAGKLVGLDNADMQTDKTYFARLLAILALVILGFNLFLLFTSNPFARLLPNIPIEGRDLNPILQDIGLILHPPMLFLGYVGLTVCFAAALASLLGGALVHRHLEYLRPWVLLAWIFLTGGNAFGSWWAYNELGWGGWWFWDPVENASFIPWLVATALVHSLVLTRKTQGFALTTLFLCILAFSLSLLGSFLVRSGIVQSVHAFAADPTRGMSILCLLVLFVGAALLIFALKAPALKREVNHNLLSKETLLLLGSIVLVVAAFSVLLGTFYPLLYELLGLGTLSVGAPYFNAIFVPLTFIAVILMGITPLIAWKASTRKPLKVLALPSVVIVIIAALMSYQTQTDGALFLFLGCTSALFLLCCLGVSVTVTSKVLTTPKPAISTKSKRARLAMLVGHLGVSVTIIGATAVSFFEQEALLRMGPGQGKPLADYVLVYESTEPVETPSFTAIQANISIRDAKQDDLVLGYLHPQRQTFNSNGMEVSHAGIDHGFWRDLYVSMGLQLSDTEYLIRISYKPLATWIWLGALLMMLAGAIAAWPIKQPRRVAQTKALNVSSSPQETMTL
ncbi:heme lyase CcmF/NrfE family subunit [Shewanella mangrovisoli]|uniref:heme lyase CcmF/NrfE family subunit n=1 Tax=Shewanella mangrovisoli TaxID=2864211 RepID=UPI001C65F29D|nr:heme lyase CcmF/NrfE family subunit [Shewanella mangrovisoli]QYK09641.1 heme lyase CcmF/NrfE family subunit [Shewanella mangrovisoli]